MHTYLYRGLSQKFPWCVLRHTPADLSYQRRWHLRSHQWSRQLLLRSHQPSGTVSCQMTLSTTIGITTRPNMARGWFTLSFMTHHALNQCWPVYPMGGIEHTFSIIGSFPNWFPPLLNLNLILNATAYSQITSPYWTLTGVAATAISVLTTVMATAARSWAYWLDMLLGNTCA